MKGNGQIALEGGFNFRDFGGLMVGKGKHIRKGLLYRSGSLSGLTEHDCRMIDALGISRVFDLRLTLERGVDRSKWPKQHARVFTFPDMHAAVGDRLREALEASEVSQNAIRDMVLQSYDEILKAMQPAVGAILMAMHENSSPLLIHCSAGKDRTGIVCAMVQRALGARRHDIVENYALSDQLVDYFNLFLEESSTEKRNPFVFLRGTRRDLIEPLMRSDPRYLESILDRFDQNASAFIDYLSVAGVVPDAISGLKQTYIVPAS